MVVVVVVCVCDLLESHMSYALCSPMKAVSQWKGQESCSSSVPETGFSAVPVWGWSPWRFVETWNIEEVDSNLSEGMGEQQDRWSLQQEWGQTGKKCKLPSSLYNAGYHRKVWLRFKEGLLTSYNQVNKSVTGLPRWFGFSWLSWQLSWQQRLAFTASHAKEDSSEN